MRKLMKNKLAVAGLIFTMVCGCVTGCGSAKYSESANTMDLAASDYSGASDYVAEESQAEDGDYGLSKDVASTANGAGTSESKRPSTDKKKIIKRYNFSYETEQFDEAYSFLRQQTEAHDGYVDSSEVNGTDSRTLYITIRVPADQCDKFVEQIGSLGTLTRQSESAEDVTLKYADTESRIESLKTEQKRLLDLLDKADSLETIITLEDRLTEVRYELESYESQRRLYDDLIDYSTVEITLYEVSYTVAVDDSTVFTRIKTGLEKSFRNVKNGLVNFIVWFIVSMPYLIVWGIIIYLIVWIVKSIIKFNKKRKAKREAKKLAKAQKSQETKVAAMDASEQNDQQDTQKKES